jgi:hypothetical protein
MIRPFQEVYFSERGSPTAARALRLTIQPWEVRGTDDFDRVCCDGKERPDGLYVAAGPMNANAKRIVGFGLKNRLPSMYATKKL